MVGALQRLNCIITAVVLPSSTPLGPRSRGLHSHTGGPPKQVLVSLEGDGPVRETRNCYSRKPIFGTVPQNRLIFDYFLSSCAAAGHRSLLLGVSCGATSRAVYWHQAGFRRASCWVYRSGQAPKNGLQTSGLCNCAMKAGPDHRSWLV